MHDDNEPRVRKTTNWEFGCELSTLSVSDLEERILQFEDEIQRLTTEKKNKTNSLNAAEAFFKN